MEEKLYSVKAFAKLTGVTERTLRYYDRIQLLKPSQYNEKGHRLYGAREIHHMQKILTLKYLGYSLSNIKEKLVETEDVRFQDTLKQQKEMLKKKREEIDFILGTIDKVENLTGEQEVDSNLLLALIHSIQHEQSQKEILSKYFSDQFVKQAFLEDKLLEEREAIERQFVSYLTELTELHKKGNNPSDEEVQHVIAQVYDGFLEILSEDLLEEIEGQEELKENDFLFSYFPPEVEKFLAKAFEVYQQRQAEEEK